MRPEGLVGTFRHRHSRPLPKFEKAVVRIRSSSFKLPAGCSRLSRAVEPIAVLAVLLPLSVSTDAQVTVTKHAMAGTVAFLHVMEMEVLIGCS